MRGQKAEDEVELAVRRVARVLDRDDGGERIARAQVDALMGIAWALLALNETLKQQGLVMTHE
jgi:hypothetical protein